MLLMGVGLMALVSSVAGLRSDAATARYVAWALTATLAFVGIDIVAAGILEIGWLSVAYALIAGTGAWLVHGRSA